MAMAHSEASPQYKNRGRLLKTFGGLLLLTGVSFAFFGPVELYCFYLFSPGGRFHYEGFGFGSLMFANIAAQIAGYYVLAALGIGLGIGHLKLKRWAYELALTLDVAWLIVGLPLTLVALWMFVTSKDPSVASFLAALPVAALIYPVGPLLLLRFYRGENVRRTFEEANPVPSPLASIPVSVRVLCVLLILAILALHGMILLNGLFPFFGVLLFGLSGIQALDALFLGLGGIIWGLSQLKRWAWWGAFATFVALTISTVLTLPHYTVGSVLELTRFAPMEIETLQNIPFLDKSPTLVAVLPLLVMLGLIGWTHRHFLRTTDKESIIKASEGDAEK